MPVTPATLNPKPCNSQNPKNPEPCLFLRESESRNPTRKTRKPCILMVPGLVLGGVLDFLRVRIEVYRGTRLEKYNAMRVSPVLAKFGHILDW